MTLAEERRQNRSSDPLVALHYQLAHARSDGHLDVIVVADDAGLVVAGAGAWAACEELAAYAPLLAHAPRDRAGWSEPGLAALSRVAEIRAQVDVQEVDVDGQTMLLCARGGRSEPAALDRTARGVARILRQAA